MKRYILFILANIIPLMALSNDTITFPDAQTFDQALPQINPTLTITPPTNNTSSVAPMASAPVTQTPAPQYYPLPSTPAPTPVIPATPAAPAAPSIQQPPSTAPSLPHGNTAQPNAPAGYNGGLFLGGNSNNQTDSQAKDFMIY